MGLMRDYISLICSTSDETLGDIIVVYNISGVYSEIKSGVVTNQEGEDTANNTLVIVPFKCKCSESYVSPKQWEQLSTSEKQNHYTFREGDTILINNTPVNCETADEIKNKYDDCFTIQGIKKYDKVYPHFELICK